ncbi:ATP-dependent zinc metalloprotease FtsH [Anaerocolumna cellulosilytica]|uniref:ATP-dependent zinc metalloprotease FtsH n=1 Tax=Anaerocolumna cellulosilytica TaxID=433286 RepID=A0A6S6R655_9FIRM|nr:ATP-dependent metallopeptidase FtsH/Yme1/Tma family protein [Anaerocolumna cellulosilytica]MBB5194266.1 cell division protease FtsH [Anaerocolumna cellulosilytica]BCJ94521.1 ATP-dependent zinc metalloprotease FtsH [Anaerocolumna cellulosilytica]
MKKTIIILLSVLAFISLSVFIFLNLDNKSQEMSYPSFLEALEQNKVDSVKIKENGNTFLAVLKGNKKQTYTIPNPKTEDFIEFLLTNNITVTYGETSAFVRVFQFLILIAVAGGVFYYMRRGGSNKPLIADATKNMTASTVTLNQVAGNAEAKMMVGDIIEFIKDPEKYTAVGARMPKGLLLYGPPGTGKTLMAKAIAGEANVPFYAMSGSDFVQMYVGVGASRIRNLFNKAKKSERAVIFIDEIDAIGKKRARNASASNDERDQTLNALLTEMSGFHDNKGIVVIGATNRLDTLDEALLRPGRFDRQIEIALPDINARKKILQLHADKKPLAEDVDLDALSKSTVYFSGAMLENLLNEAAINAANDKMAMISRSHIDKAFYTVIAGAPIQDRSYITDRDKNITAYHEAGHALATKLLQPENYISKVTIIPSVRGAGGFNLSIPKDTMFQTRRQIEASIQMLLAGRAAEELIFGSDEITTGASNDIQKASAMLVDYINKYGMDEDMGLFNVSVLEEGYDRELLSKCRCQMNQLYDSTRTLLEKNLSSLKAITIELLEKESLTGEDINRIVA